MKRNKEKSMLGSIFYFISLIFKISPLFVVGELISGVLLTLPTRLVSVIGIKYIIDVYTSKHNLERIYFAVGVIAAAFVITRLLYYLFREIFWNTGRERVFSRLSQQLYEKAKTLDLEKYDNPDFYTDFILTIESSSDNVQFLMTLVRNYFADVVSLITISSVMLTIDPICLIIIFVVVIAFLPLSNKVGKLQMDRRTDNAKYHRRSDYFQRIFYLCEYSKEVRMNGIRPLLIKRYDEAADDVTKNQRQYWGKISLYYFLQESGVQILGFMALLPLYLGYLVLVKKTIGAGDFVAAYNGAYSIAVSINFLTVWAIARFSEQAKMIEKFRAFLNTDCKISDMGNKASEAKPETIEIKNLSFTYPNSNEKVLNNITLTVKPYEKLALVGYNGAGKTTLTNLILRLYDPDSGEILIGGENIKNVSASSHRSRFAAVYQDYQLYSCTLGENVAMDVEYDQQRAESALKAAGFSKELSNGLSTEMLREFDKDGVMLSGGEAQKAAIARAFYKSCPYAILDEPSANLDPIAEYNLNQAMIKAAENKTVIFISHRLSTTVNADRICVLKDGAIAEEGTHSELMKKGGLYAEMFTLQAEKYKK